MNYYTKQQLEKAIKSKGYVWFDNECDYDVNIIAVRNDTPGNKVTNLFDDTITISYKFNGVWVCYNWQCTTDPGKVAMQNPVAGGCARLVPGQYRSSHTIRLHRGLYKALCQQNPVTVYRDDNRDLIYDTAKHTTGLYGINIHRSNPLTESNYVDNWSYGCTVFKRVKDFNVFMSICEKAAGIHGNHFTYTLLESTDF